MGIKDLRELSDEQWIVLYKENWTVSGILRELGVVKETMQMRKLVISNAERLNISRNNPSGKKGRIPYDEGKLRKAVADAICWSDVLRSMDLSIHGFNTDTLKKYVTHYNIDISHFDASAAFARNRNLEYSDQEVFRKNAVCSRGTVKTRVLKLGLIKYECQMCGNNGTWLDQQLNLQLDHIDGDWKNNELDNLRFLCLNCHSLTPTYCGKKRTN